MNILIAVDGSPASLGAVRLAGRLVSADRDEIVLYYSPPGLELVQTVAGATVLRGREALAQSVFADAKARLPVNWSPAVQTVIGASDPSEGILHAARDRKSDLIVVGARGMGRLERLLLGSVSRAVVHAAEVPVLVVRDAERAAASSDFRVLVAFEGETSGRQLAAVLGRFTWPAGTSAVSLHVVESVFGGKIPDWLDAQARAPEAEALVKLWVKDHDEQLAASARQVQQVCQELPEPLRGAEHCVREGVAEHEIVELAREQRLRSDRHWGQRLDSLGPAAAGRHGRVGA